ncbi:hypothetical protein D0C36_13110 [Mucilaginibacter conchicola]|uniref:Uncharacterized protein n=1 Tax=Mucilaginibacter conchicola TaxID=2303333 RepID=A0A372NSZ0_9SPHI|nr:hypothetical protein [Mucilaginibacter conchicola]RFZ92365.1 hypothetical protein D0C36_13110 [Mucilaginibacter conchicola]
MNNPEISITGGGNIGNVRMSGPFMKLIVSKDKLELRASIMGRYVFLPSDVISVTPAGIGGGVRINHTVGQYNKEIIFRSLGSDVIAQIASTGFLNNMEAASPQLKAEVEIARQSTGFAIKTSAAIAFVVIWNLFFLYDQRGLLSGGGIVIGGIGTRSALGFAAVFALLMLFVEPFQILVLKPGRDAKDLRFFMFFLLFVSVAIFIGMSAMPGAAQTLHK